MKLLLIDLSHIFWTRFHATAGQGVDAAFQASYECVQSLKDGHDKTIICCDIGKSWRHVLDPQYKANRPERDPAAYDQLRRLRETLQRDGYPVVAVEGYEADDIIATLVTQATGPEHGWQAAGRTDTFDLITIATGDKDLLQLTGLGVACVSTNAGSNSRDRRGPDFVQQKFGVSVGQLRDFLALVGDKSDNVPGCPSVGEKTAAKLLSDFVTIEGIYASLDRIDSVPLRTKLIEHKAQVDRSRELVTLSTGVPITLADALKVVAPPPAASGGEELPEDSDSNESDDHSDSSIARQDAGNPASVKPALSFGDDRRPPIAGGESPSAAPLVTTMASGAVSEAIVLDKSDPRWSLALEPRGLKQVWWLATHFHQSQLYRKVFANEDAIAVAILKGRSLGLDMMTSLSVIRVVEGTPTVAALAIVGIVLASGKAEYFEFVGGDERSATWKTKRRGGLGEVTHKYTIEEADAAGLLRPSKSGYPSNWTRIPRPMLRKQAGVELARLVYPDVGIVNLYDPDEFGGGE